MKLDIVIPSKNRKEKLQKCLNSLFLSGKDILDLNIFLYLSSKEEYDYYRFLFSNIRQIIVRRIADYRVPDFWNAFLCQCESDAMMYINDDIEFLEETIPIVLENYYSRFPDYDGVMGLNQVNITDPNKVEAAFGVIGLKYADRFPDRQVFPPCYNRFYGDFELWLYAREINKFYFCEEARILHHHPSTNRSLEDSTHIDVRKWLAKDRAIFNLRKEKQLLWGRSFEL